MLEINRDELARNIDVKSEDKALLLGLISGGAGKKTDDKKKVD
jgi:hypothetical protein